MSNTANVGSDCRDFSVARSTDVIAVRAISSRWHRHAHRRRRVCIRSCEDNEAVLARAVPSPSEGCRAAIISRTCVVIADTELCSAR